MPEFDHGTSSAFDDTIDEGSVLVHLLSQLVRALRDEGVKLATERLLTFSRMTPRISIGWGVPRFLSHYEDIQTYDRVFRAAFSNVRGRPPSSALKIDDDEAAKVAGEKSLGPMTPSQVELLRNKSFDALTEAELAQVALLIANVTILGCRRAAPGGPKEQGGVGRIASTIRESFRSGGKPLTRHWRRRKERQRRLILLMDVSPIDGALLAGSHDVRARGVARGHPTWEAFCLAPALRG